MADFFDKLKEGLNKGLTTASVKSKEMFDANRVKSQIADLEKRKKDAVAELGTTVCAMLDRGALDEASLREARLAIGEFDEQILAKQQELVEIRSQAQRDLQQLTQPSAASAPTGTGLGGHCTSCGTPLVAGAKFCGGCGKAVS
jgi:hypothetical protein